MDVWTRLLAESLEAWAEPRTQTTMMPIRAKRKELELLGHEEGPLFLSPMPTYSWSSHHHHHGDRENHAVGFLDQGRMHISTPITSPDNEWSCEQKFHSPRLSDIIAKVSAHCTHPSSTTLAMGLPIISWTPKKTQVHKKGQRSRCLQSCKGEHQESTPLRNRLLQDPI